MAILPGEIGIIGGSIILIVCVGCIISGAVHIIRLFKPDSPGGAGD